MTVAIGLVGGAPAFGGLDFTLPPLPSEQQTIDPSAEADRHDKADLPGLQIAPGVTLSPDLDASSPYAVADPAKRSLEPLLRLQVPIPP